MNNLDLLLAKTGTRVDMSLIQITDMDAFRQYTELMMAVSTRAVAAGQPLDETAMIDDIGLMQDDGSLSIFVNDGGALERCVKVPPGGWRLLTAQEMSDLSAGLPKAGDAEYDRITTDLSKMMRSAADARGKPDANEKPSRAICKSTLMIFDRSHESIQAFKLLCSRPGLADIETAGNEWLAGTSPMMGVCFAMSSNAKDSGWGCLIDDASPSAAPKVLLELLKTPDVARETTLSLMTPDRELREAYAAAHEKLKGPSKDELTSKWSTPFDDASPEPFYIQARPFLKRQARSKGVSVSDTKRIMHMNAIVAAIPTYHLPFNGEWLFQELAPSSSIDIARFVPHAPAALIQFGVAQTPHPLLAALGMESQITKRLALVADLRSEDGYMAALPFLGAARFPSAAVNRNAIFVLPIDNCDPTSKDSPLSGWSLPASAALVSLAEGSVTIGCQAAHPSPISLSPCFIQSALDAAGEDHRSQQETMNDLILELAAAVQFSIAPQTKVKTLREPSMHNAGFFRVDP